MSARRNTSANAENFTKIYFINRQTFLTVCLQNQVLSNILIRLLENISARDMSSS